MAITNIKKNQYMYTSAFERINAEHELLKIIYVGATVPYMDSGLGGILCSYNQLHTFCSCPV